MATLKETAKYFGISFQALAEYVKKYLDEINVDGQHAFIRKGKWHFDEVAIQRLTAMRNEKEEFMLPYLESQHPNKNVDKKILQTWEVQKLISEVAGMKKEFSEMRQQVVESLQELNSTLQKFKQVVKNYFSEE